MKCPKCQRYLSPGSSVCKTCGASLPDDTNRPTQTLKTVAASQARKFKAGDSFGSRYQILTELGRGGMAVVYRARDLELGIEVALKMIRPEFLVNEQIVVRFKKEILLAREITHENVVRIFDFAEHEGIKFITMQYIEGETLKDMISREGPLDLARATDIFSQVCSGLAAAHNVGVVHRDLKAHNIMVDHSGHAYITDFGLAKSLDGQELSVTGAVVGTPEYISPEQASGQPVDHRSDVYTLGLILYEMVTGRLPYKASTAMGYLQKHLQEQPLSPALFREDLPPYLEKIIMRCLAKLPLERYASVDLLRRDVTGREVRSSGGKAPWKQKVMLPVLIVLLLFLGWYLVFHVFGPSRRGGGEGAFPSIRQTMAVVPFKNKTGDASLDHWQEALQDLLMTDLGQSLYFRVLPESRLLQVLKDARMEQTTAYDTDSLRKLARYGGIDLIIYGSYVADGQKIRTTARVWDAGRGDEVNAVYAEAPNREHLYAIVDQLTRRIKYSARLTEEEIDKDYDEDIGKITTSSQEAHQYYLRGNKLYLDQKYQESIQAFRKALSLDPDFALAYRRIAENYQYLGNSHDSFIYLNKALALVDRVSKREKLLIKGYDAWIVKKNETGAIEYYRQLLKDYPDDETALLYIGSIYRNLENWDQALKWFDKLRSVNENSQIAHMNLNYVYKAKGWYEKSIQLLKSQELLFADRKLFHYRLMRTYMCQGRYSLALAEWQKAKALDEKDYRNYEYRGNIHQLQEHFSQAEENYKQLLAFGSINIKIRGYSWLSHLYLAMGRYALCENFLLEGIRYAAENKNHFYTQDLTLSLGYLKIQLGQPGEAKGIVTKMLKNHDLELSDEIRISLIHMKGLTHVMLHEWAKVQESCELLKDLFIRRGFMAAGRRYHHLMALKAVRNSRESALTHINQSIDYLPAQFTRYDSHAFFMDARALLYHKTGFVSDAQQTYEKILALTVGRLMYGHLCVLAHYRLAKIFQDRGWRGKAIEHYQKFLMLWRDADPGMSELTDARKQLNTLLASR